ncbi:MAG: hypothetical protein VX777_00945 [Chlamydiota bacterium]|nr:hypothetical protein [Chlamydiota bacterium]
MVQISPARLVVLINSLESQVKNDDRVKQEIRSRKLDTLKNSLKDSFWEIDFKTRLLPKKELDSLISLKNSSISKPVDMQKVKGHLWGPIAYDVDELTGGYFYTFKVKDNGYGEFHEKIKWYHEVNESNFPVVEKFPGQFKSFSYKKTNNDSKSIIEELAETKAFSIYCCLNDVSSEEQLLLKQGSMSNQYKFKIEKIEEKYPFLHEAIEVWIDHWENPQDYPKFSFLSLFGNVFEAHFSEKYKKNEQSDRDVLYFFESMRTWLFRNLGYRFNKNCDTNKIESVRFPDFQSLSERWKLCKNHMPHLPDLVFTDAEGISSDELYVKKVTVEGDILLSNGKEFFHDQSAHIIPLINSIGFSGIKCDKTYKKGKEILTSFYSNVFVKVERATSVQLLSGDILELNSEQKNYMRALASALVDGATSQTFIQRKNNFSSIERSFLVLKILINDQNWKRYFKKRFDSNLVDSPDLFLEIFYQLLFGSKSEG